MEVNFSYIKYLKVIVYFGCFVSDVKWLNKGVDFEVRYC